MSKPTTADEQRRVLDAFHSRQATRYIELLKTLPPEQQPSKKKRAEFYDEEYEGPEYESGVDY